MKSDWTVLKPPQHSTIVGKDLRSEDKRRLSQTETKTFLKIIGFQLEQRR